MLRLRSALVVCLTLGAARTLVAQIATGKAAPNATPSPEIAQSIEALEARLERALLQRNRAELEAIVATPFTWVHAVDGRVDSRNGWLAAAAQGMALTGQRSVRTEHGATLAAYGAPQPSTVVRVSGVQIVDSA